MAVGIAHAPNEHSTYKALVERRPQLESLARPKDRWYISIKRKEKESLTTSRSSLLAWRTSPAVRSFRD